MDYAVNSGVSRASKALQSVCNAGKDGIIGPHTLNAVHITCNDRGQEFVIEGVTTLRKEFIRGLSIYDTFSKGWERRITETYEHALEHMNG
jgi:lysozyme family protein